MLCFVMLCYLMLHPAGREGSDEEQEVVTSVAWDPLLVTGKGDGKFYHFRSMGSVTSDQERRRGVSRELTGLYVQEGDGSSLSEQRKLLSQGVVDVFSDTVFETLFPTNVETLTTPVLATLMFIVWVVSLIVWFLGHRYQSNPNQP